MDTMQRLAYCKQCEKRKFDASIGIVCSLTNRKPDFDAKCADFVMDQVQVQKVSLKAAAAQEEKSNTSYIWVIVGVVLIIIRILIRLNR